MIPNVIKRQIKNTDNSKKLRRFFSLSASFLFLANITQDVSKLELIISQQVLNFDRKQCKQELIIGWYAKIDPVVSIDISRI